MIIEGAFYKLPELLLGHSFPESQYEATLTSNLAMAILLELNARNVPMPQGRVHVERPYEVSKPGPACRADLYVDLEGLYPTGSWLRNYGVKEKNWIESKFYGGIGRASGTETKTSNAGQIARDLLRLCLFVEELQGKIRHNGRYLLVVFNRKPEAYLAFQRAKGQDRHWLRQLLSPGRHCVSFSTRDEASSFLKGMGSGFVGSTASLDLALNVITYSFTPDSESFGFAHQGYLVRIVDFEIAFGLHRLEFMDRADIAWTKEQADLRKQMAEQVVGLIGGNA